MKKKILLDVKGLRCPIPVLRAQKIIKKLNTGDILEVLTTDPKSIQDFKKKKGVFTILICKGI